MLLDIQPQFSFPPISLKLAQMDAEHTLLGKDVVGAAVGLNPDSVADWKLLKSHVDCYYFTPVVGLHHLELVP